MEQRTTASTHTGGGGFEIGAMLAGHKPVLGIEIRPDIALVAKHNLKGLSMIISDVASVIYRALPWVWHLHSSPSCKNASQAHKAGEEAMEDMESALAICAALRALKPVVFTLENVSQYRDFDSFRLILKTLHELSYCVKYWVLNSADYGVPQTRKRLIVIARRDKEPIKPQATHYKPDAKKALKGMRSLFWQPWNGWYSAIEDLIPGLPETEPAPWQLARMPEKYKTMLVAQGAYDGVVVNREEDEPAFTITANSNQGGVKAFLLSNSSGSTRADGKVLTIEESEPAMTVTGESSRLRALKMPGGGNTNFAEAKPGKGVRYEDEPAQTVTTVTQAGGSLPRAFIVDSQGAGKPSGVTNRHATEPMFTVTDQGKGLARAFVVGSQYGQSNKVKDRSPQIREGDEPYFTVTVSGGVHSDQRIYVGHWVSITPRCLARFQSIPDWYELPGQNGLACEVVGNAVPPLLAKAICESLKD